MIRTSRLAGAAIGAVLSAIVVAPAPATANHGGPSSPVVGYIQILAAAPTAANPSPVPTYALFGALANPALWTCSNPSVVPYVVTCTPASTAVNLVWHCDVLHADIHGLSPNTNARTSLDCNGDNAYEAQTAWILGPLYSFDWAASTMTVTSFSCRVDGGPNNPLATPAYRAGCGDPGIVRFHEH
ncbi:MAG TPA: hypothetical protein VNA20_09030 [Frankiaceae bacterium]|nr:hypothetical protein [Frankiaceae bacterium]